MLSVLFRMAAALQERSASSEFLLLYCFVSGLCCFLPLFLGCASYLENRPLRDSINDCPEFRYGSAASMALAVPLFIDALLDLRNSGGTALIDVAKTTKQNNYDTVRYNCLNISERILFLMGIVILPVVSLLSLKTENLALIFVCCSKCQINWVGGAVIISLTRYNKDFWSINSSLISLMAFSVGLITSVFVDNTYARTNSPSFDIILLDQVSLVFTIIPSAIFLFNGMRWLLLVHCQAHSWTKHFMTSAIFQDQLTNTGDLLVFNKVRHVFFPTMYVICGITVVALLSLLVGLSHRLENYDRMKLFQCILPFLLFVTGVSTLSMRMVKYEVVQGLVSDMNKLYDHLIHLV